MPNNSNYTLDQIKEAIIDLYQNVKIRKESETITIDESYLKKEKSTLENVSPLTLISYIKNHIGLLIDVKVTEKLSLMNSDPSLLFSEYGSDITPTNYENLLRRYESDIRNYIKIENILKLHIEELNYKIEILEKNIESLKQKIPKDENIYNNKIVISYKKKIDELSNLIKMYEKSNLKIPILEKKIKVQKLELDKLNYYKNQCRSFSKKIEKYEKESYLKSARNTNSTYSNFTILKPKNKINNKSRTKNNTNIINSTINNNNTNSLLTTNIHSPSFITMTQRTGYNSLDEENDKTSVFISSNKRDVSPISLTKKVKCISAIKKSPTKKFISNKSKNKNIYTNRNNFNKGKNYIKNIPKSPLGLKDNLNKNNYKYNNQSKERNSILKDLNKTISDIDKVPFVNYINIYSNINSNNSNFTNNIPKKENNNAIRNYLLNKINNLTQQKSIISKRESSHSKSFLENN